MEQTKQNKFTYVDAGRVFLYAILMPQIIGVLFLFLVGSLANLFGTTYEIVIENVIVKASTLFLAQIGFLIVFFTYQSVKKIDWVKATKIKHKINYKQVITLIIIAAASLFLFSPLINLVDYLISLTGYSASADLPVNLKTVEGFLVGVVALAILPAICEELIFRGVLYQGFLQKFDYKKAILFSALLFSLMHTSIQQTVYQFIIGAMLAYAFYITGSLLAPIVLHFMNNFIVILLNLFVDSASSSVPTFHSLYDYGQVIIATIIGAYVVWQLFELLKKFSKPLNETNREEIDILEQKTTEQESLQPVEEFNFKKPVSALFKLGIAFGIILWVLDFISFLS